MISPPLPPADLKAILAATAPLWEAMRGQRLFLTGGTGFFGCWLTESFLHINRALSLEARLTVLSRNPQAFLAKLPHLAQDPALTLLAGDVRTFPFPADPHRFILHAATEASALQAATRPHEMLSTILAGTERTLAFAAATGATRMLFTSSGAVYGPQPPHIAYVNETYTGAPDPLLPASVYAEGKRAAEQMCALAATPQLEIAIARCFAFVGPHLPLDAHFAAGNFLRDALSGTPICIQSDGSSLRSYLYASDLTTWLWTMLFQAPSLRAYNVGSEDSVDIITLARTVCTVVNPSLPAPSAQPPAPDSIPHRYVPSTARARTELGLHQTVSLTQALERTAAWQRLK